MDANTLTSIRYALFLLGVIVVFASGQLQAAAIVTLLVGIVFPTENATAAVQQAIS